jgi:hypothetical protein
MSCITACKPARINRNPARRNRLKAIRSVAIAQTTYATDASVEIQALRQLLGAVELDGVLVQAEALHANHPFSSTSPNAVPTS